MIYYFCMKEKKVRQIFNMFNPKYKHNDVLYSYDPSFEYMKKISRGYICTVTYWNIEKGRFYIRSLGNNKVIHSQFKALKMTTRILQQGSEIGYDNVWPFD